MDSWEKELAPRMHHLTPRQNHVATPHQQAVEYEFSDESPPSVAVVEAICACENTNPTDDSVRFVLNDHIDSSALDSVITRSKNEDVMVRFQIGENPTYNVEVGNERIYLH